MKLNRAPPTYDPIDQSGLRGALETADAENFKKGRDLILSKGQRIVLPDEATGQLYRLKVAGGVLSITAYP